MELRYYQRASVQATLDAIQNTKDNPCLEIPTGGGKTPIIASLCKVLTSAGARVLVVAHRKELLAQTADKMKEWASNVSFGVVSAGLNKREYDGQVVIAGIQSVYRQVDKITEQGKIDFVIVDEAHLIPTTDENAEGMYQTLLKELRSFNPKLRVIGLTATPYRLTSGSVCGNDKILTSIVYRVGISELISAKYLTPLISKAPPSSVADRKFTIERGEFKSNEVQEAYNVDSVVSSACSEIKRLATGRKNILVFCCGIDHCQQVAKTLARLTNDEVGIVTGNTPKDERDELIRRFKGDLHTDLLGNVEKPIRFLCNVDVLTTGFDAPIVDCVVLLRPTLSPGLFYQMCGRGFRLYDGKENCLILDFGGNLKRFGPVDKIEPPTGNKGKKEKREDKSKICPTCYATLEVNARICPNCLTKLYNVDFLCPKCGAGNDSRNNFCGACGFQFRQPLPHHGTNADETSPILSTDIPKITEQIIDVRYLQHKTKSGRNCLRVDYYTNSSNFISEYVCLEHEGFARIKAVKWWNDRTTINPVPISARQALEIIQTVGFYEPTEITYLPRKSNKDFIQIVEVKPIKRKVPRVPFPRVDNPLNLRCQNCDGHSFLYEKVSEREYRIICAQCEELTTSINYWDFSNPDKFKEELETVRLANIGWFAPNQIQDDFDSEFFVEEETEDLSDVPF